MLKSIDEAVGKQGEPGAGPHSSKQVRIMPFQIRHRQQVYELYGKIFSERSRVGFEARWEWGRENDLFFDGGAKWVLVDNDRVVGFLNTVPLAYRIGGTTLTAHTPADYMVDPEYRFYGLQLMHQFFRTCANCVSADDVPSTIKVTEWLGAKRAGRLVGYVKVLDGRALRQHERLNRVPLLAQWLLTGALGLRDTVRLAGRNALHVEPLREFDRRLEKFFLQISQRAPAMPVRDLRFLQWRYGPTSPHPTREIAVVTDGGGNLLGYVVFHLSVETHRGLILDLLALPEAGVEVPISLMRYAVKRLRAEGAWTVRYFASPGAMPVPDLRRLGFIRRGDFVLSVKFADPGIQTIATRPGAWNYSFGDSEASHAFI